MHAMYHLSISSTMKFNHCTLLFVFTVSILATQFPAILPAPVRMRTHNASAIHSYSDVSQSTVCAVQELKDALYDVKIEQEVIIIFLFYVKVL